MGAKRKLVVFYYTQTGQLKNIVNSIVTPLQEGVDVVWKQIFSIPPFQFPWSTKNFFQAFPESRMGIPLEIEPIDLSDVQDADAVLLAYQPWFLSPSIPISTFLQQSYIQQFLNGKSVILVAGTRNMWIQSQKIIMKLLSDAGATTVGNIVLRDKTSNLVSVLTIVRWLIRGKKEASRFLPAAGVSDSDIAASARFAPALMEAIQTGNYTNLQAKLYQLKAVEYLPFIAFIERNGHRLFGIWASFILKKGGYQAPQRAFRLKCFMYYLFAVLYLVAPIGYLVFYITYPFRIRTIKHDKRFCCMLTK